MEIVQYTRNLLLYPVPLWHILVVALPTYLYFFSSNRNKKIASQIHGTNDSVANKERKSSAPKEEVKKCDEIEDDEDEDEDEDEDMVLNHQVRDDYSILKLNPDIQCKMLLCVNMELSMDKGKIAAQCGHGTLGAYLLAKKYCNSAVQIWENFG
jgi:PTH2 family peptidyl-tRNA hydrolase